MLSFLRVRMQICIVRFFVVSEMMESSVVPYLIVAFFTVVWLIWFILCPIEHEKCEEHLQYGTISIDDLFDEEDIEPIYDKAEEETEPKPVVANIRDYNWRKWPWYYVWVYLFLLLVSIVITVLSVTVFYDCKHVEF